MKEILRNINKIQDVRGTLVLTPEGLVVAADLSGDEEPAALGAVTSSVMNSLKKSMTRLERGQMQRFVLTGAKGSVVAFTTTETILLTLLQKDANMGLVLIELKESAARLAALMKKE